MVDGLLYLREGYAGCSVVDISVIVGQVECRDDGRLQVIIFGQISLVFAPCFKESVGLEVRTSFCSSSSLLKRHGYFVWQEASLERKNNVVCCCTEAHLSDTTEVYPEVRH